MSAPLSIDPKVEELARKIAIDHDLDPDDARLGHPAWRIGWIMEEAEKRARDAAERDRTPQSPERKPL